MKKSQSIQYFIFAFLIGLFSLSADASLADKHSDQDYPNNEFLNSVYEKVQYNLVYPEKAKEENREGIVKVRFLLKKDGSIEGLEIEESSGCPLLDKAALDAVRDASPYPFPFTDRDEILLILPVGFGSGLTAEAQAQPSLQQYTQILLNQISPFLIYPKEAQDKGISGTVKVGLVVNREGNIDELEIKESSGSKLLDDAALKAIKKAYPLPFPFTDKKEIRMLLPVSFGIELTGYQPKAEVKETATTSLPENETLNSVAPASSMSIQEYIKLIAGKISTNIAYPEQASLKAGQADVRIKFMIAKDGSVRSAEIEKSSGYLDLDKAVIMAINKSAPYPFPFTDKDTLSLLLPISFDLNGQSEYQEIKNPELQTGPTPITSPEEYREALLKKISSFLIYPQEAKNKGLSGTVKLKFLVTKDGLPRRIEIKESSGLDILDKAALEAITNASPYPFPFADKEELEVTIPIAFGLEIPRFKPRQDKADFQTMTVQEYRRVLLRQILNQVSFPDSAKEKGLSGLVKVAFRVKKDGSIDNLGIEQSSNFPELDKAAIDAVSRGVPYPFPFTDKECIEVALPVRFGSEEIKQEFSEAVQYQETSPRAGGPEEYSSLLLEKFSSNLTYPAEALEKSLQGIAKIKFLVRRDGQVENVQIVRTSGYPLLDKAAVLTVQNSVPLPAYLSEDGKPCDIEVTLPLRFGGLDQPILQTAGQEELKPGAKEGAEREISGREKEETEKLKEFDLAGNLHLDNLYKGFLPSELKEFIKIALENNQPLQTAKKDMELAKFKINEALRNFFPALKVQIYSTQGDVHKVDYEESEIKTVFTQPLYYGGGLTAAHKQAKTNLKITERNFDQQMLETIHKTEVSYHSLITLRMNLKRQEEILQEAGKMLKATELQFREGLIIPLEHTKVQSWYKRLSLMKDAIAQELDMAYLAFQQTLNTEGSPKVSLLSLDIKEFDISLESCIDSALKSRPEINLARLWTEYYKHGKKVEDAKDSFNVDFTGSYGYYQGAYVTEPMKSSTNWYLGIKVTKPFGGSTTTTSLFQEQSQPRFGQTSPTGQQTVNAEIGILDNLKAVSERKSAEVTLLKAEDQLEETRKNITFEVQDSFLKYQKSLLEVKSAFAQKNFRQEELKIARANVYIGGASFSSLIETLVNLSDAENTYLRALGNYYISLATLRKTTGYGLNF